MNSEYDFSGHTFQTRSGFQMHYLDEGPRDDDAPVLMLHGNPTWSFFYRRVIRSLSSVKRCIVPDHIGCGFSEKPNFRDFPYDLNTHSKNLIDLMEHLEIKRVTLLVHDWGGAIGLTAFRDRPDQVKKIALLNTAAFPSSDVPKRILLCRTPVLGQIFVRGFNGFAWPATWMATTKGLSKEAKQGFLHPYRTWQDRVAVWRFVKDIPYEEDHPSLQLLQDTSSKLDCFRSTPIMTCWGMRDFCFSPRFLDAWKKKWPHMEVHEMQKAGHYVLEDAYEECEAQMKPFLLN